jgi:uncharacterized protein (TIGR02246 family)
MATFLQAIPFLLLSAILSAQNAAPPAGNPAPAIDWTRAATLTGAGAAPTPQAEERSIRAIVKTFADARNARDGQIAAGLYSPDGEWLSAVGESIRGRAALAELWSTITAPIQRTIESIDFAGPNIAVVRVARQYPEPFALRHETFVFIRTGATWAIRVHQSLD